jgi:hypothetical protein
MGENKSIAAIEETIVDIKSKKNFLRWIIQAKIKSFSHFKKKSAS